MIIAQRQEQINHFRRKIYRYTTLFLQRFVVSKHVAQPSFWGSRSLVLVGSGQFGNPLVVNLTTEVVDHTAVNTFVHNSMSTVVSLTTVEGEMVTVHNIIVHTLM